MGFCAGFGAPGFAARGRRFGGRGPGGRGWRNWYHATGLTGWQRAAMGMQAFGGAGPAVAVSDDQQLAMLERQAQTLGQTLEDINQQIADLRGRQERKEPSPK